MNLPVKTTLPLVIALQPFFQLATRRFAIWSLTKILWMSSHTRTRVALPLEKAVWRCGAFLSCTLLNATLYFKLDTACVTRFSSRILFPFLLPMSTIVQICRSVFELACASLESGCLSIYNTGKIGITLCHWSVPSFVLVLPALSSQVEIRDVDVPAARYCLFDTDDAVCCWYTQLLRLADHGEILQVN